MTLQRLLHSGSWGSGSNKLLLETIPPPQKKNHTIYSMFLKNSLTVIHFQYLMIKPASPRLITSWLFGMDRVQSLTLNFFKGSLKKEEKTKGKSTQSVFLGSFIINKLYKIWQSFNKKWKVKWKQNTQICYRNKFKLKRFQIKVSLE